MRIDRMKDEHLDAFLNPKSVAVIGATQRPGSWGSIIMEGLLSLDYPGKIFAVNHRRDKIYDFKVFREIRDIPEKVDLAILTIPEKFVEETIEACGKKGVLGVTIVSAGFGEVTDGGLKREKDLARLARSLGMRILGPNVSGTYDLGARFNGSSSPVGRLLSTPLAGVSQGGFAFHDLLAAGSFRGMGLRKFVHTGNECDLTATDFLEHFGSDPEVKAVLMYLETVRDGKRFFEVAREVTRKKPVVVYKAGRTSGSARAAMSHTGALSGDRYIYRGMMNQVGIIIAPNMALMLPLGHALIERPAMAGRRVGILTMGGSWGVALTDTLEEGGLRVPELSETLQGRLHFLGMPERASTRNPVDIGASGIWYDTHSILALGRSMAFSGEVDALVVHGIGRPVSAGQMIARSNGGSVDQEKEIMAGFQALEKDSDIPVLIGSHYTPRECEAVAEVNKMGIRIYNDLDVIAHLLFLMHDLYRKRQHPGQ